MRIQYNSVLMCLLYFPQICGLSLPDARRVISALMPIVKVVRSLRDTLIPVLRKALFARSTEVKQIGLFGVLQMLKNFHIKSALPVTQMSQSSAGLSQATAIIQRGQAASNDLICNELIGVLRRALTQKAAVRLVMYQGLYDVVSRNPELCVSVQDVLYQHAIKNKWIESEKETKIIEVNKLVTTEELGAVVLDPVGWYLHCVQQLLTKAEQLNPNSGEQGDEGSEEDESAREKLTEMIMSLAEKYAKLELVDLDFEKEADYSRTTIQGEKNALSVDLLKNVYESLMEYVITHGADVSEDKAKLLLDLYEKHSDVAGLLKVLLIKHFIYYLKYIVNLQQTVLKLNTNSDIKLSS